MTTAKLETPVPLRQDASIMGLVGLAHASSHFSHLLLPVMFPGRTINAGMPSSSAYLATNCSETHFVRT